MLAGTAKGSQQFHARLYPANVPDSHLEAELPPGLFTFSIYYKHFQFEALQTILQLSAPFPTGTAAGFLGMVTVTNQ